MNSIEAADLRLHSDGTHHEALLAEEAIQEAIKSGDQVQAGNQATGNPATCYINPTIGQSVVVDNVTKEVIHVGGLGFRYGPESGDLP
jgi:hypothetical protein